MNGQCSKGFNQAVSKFELYVLSSQGTYVLVSDPLLIIRPKSDWNNTIG